MPLLYTLYSISNDDRIPDGNVNVASQVPAASLRNERSTVEGFVQIKRHEIHHSTLPKVEIPRESEDDSRPRDISAGNTGERGKSVYIP